MTEYDPIKAVTEELQGLGLVAISLRRREAVCEEAIAKAEQEINDVRKIRGFLDMEVERKRTVLSQLKAAKEGGK